MFFRLLPSESRVFHMPTHILPGSLAMANYLGGVLLLAGCLLFDNCVFLPILFISGSSFLFLHCFYVSMFYKSKRAGVVDMVIAAGTTTATTTSGTFHGRVRRVVCRPTKRLI